MTSAQRSPEDRLLVDSLLGRWEETVARGEQPRPETICPDRPDLWEAIVARAAQLETMAFLDGEGEESVAPGDMLAGRYRLVELLAGGGHAEVWKAHEHKLDRHVAVKLIAVGPLAAPERLIAEGRRLAALGHRHIVNVFDAGIDGEIAFLVQELVTGDTLAERIAAGPADEQRILDWISQVAEALQAAHEPPAGIIHRDVKPANILIDRHGKALLADFGIAIPIDQAAGSTSVGTLPYKSPEQLDDRPLDRRSDVFSLGLVLYESLTGTLPYSALDRDTIHREMREPLARRIARLPVERPLPAKFLPLLERTLALHPDTRPRDALDFRAELARAAAASRSPGRGRRLAIAATLVAIAATLAAIVVERLTAERARRSALEQRELEQRELAEQERERERQQQERREFEVENRQQMADVQREVNRAMGLFREVQGKISETRQLEREIMEQTRQRDPFRRDRDDGPVSPPPPPPDRESDREPE